MADGMVHYQTTVDPRYPAFQPAYPSIQQHRHGVRNSPMPPSPQQHHMMIDPALGTMDVHQYVQQLAAHQQYAAATQHYASNQPQARVHHTSQNTADSTDKGGWMQGHVSTASTGSTTAATGHPAHTTSTTPAPAATQSTATAQKADNNSADQSALVQRIRQLQRQRADAESGITRVIDQVMDQVTKQQDSCQSLTARLEREQARADTAEQSVTELNSTLAQQKQQLAAQEATAQENARMQSELAKVRQQLTSANQQATQAANATKGVQDELKSAQERVAQLENELEDAKEHVSNMDSLENDLSMWKDWCCQLFPLVPPHAHSLLNPAMLQCLLPMVFPNQLPPHLAVPPMGMHPSMMPPMWLPPHGALPPNMWLPPPGMLHTPLPPLPTATDDAYPAQEPDQRSGTDQAPSTMDAQAAAGFSPSGVAPAPVAAGNLMPATEPSWSSSQLQATAAGATAASSVLPTPVVTEGGAMQQAPATALASHPSHTSSVTEAAVPPTKQISGQRLTQMLSTNSSSSAGDTGTPKDVVPAGRRDTQKPPGRQSDAGRQGAGEGGKGRHGGRRNRQSAGRAASDASGDISSGAGARSDQDSSTMVVTASLPATGRDASGAPRPGGNGRSKGGYKGGYGGGRGKQGGAVPAAPGPVEQLQHSSTQRPPAAAGSQPASAAAGGRGPAR